MHTAELAFDRLLGSIWGRDGDDESIRWFQQLMIIISVQVASACFMDRLVILDACLAWPWRQSTKWD